MNEPGPPAAEPAVFVLRDIVMRAADLYGSQLATACGERTLTWRELADRSMRAAAWLAAHGVRRGDAVVLWSDNRLEVSELAFALAALGAVVVPLSPIVAPAEVAYIREDCTAAVGLVAPGLEPAAAAAGGRWLTIGDDEYEAAVGSGPAAEPPFSERPEDPVLQFYTSGTTGRPKGVLMSQVALLIHSLNSVLSQGLNHDDVYLTCTPITHAAGGTRIFTLGLEGITHVILPRWSTAGFFAEVARRRVTSTVLVPSMLRDVVADPRLDEADLSTLRLVVYGAAPTPPDVQLAALQRIPAGFLHSYGISEGCPALTVLTPAEHRRAMADPALRHRLGSVGRPVPGVRFRILDADGRRLPDGEAGEIHIRNAKAMLGYFNRPDEDAAVWRDGWMASGDVGYVDDEGYLYIVGRMKEMIISGGLNVYPAEVERVLLEHDAVSEAAVVGVPDERWGETPAAFIVAAADVSDEELREHCRARMARYKLPSSFSRVAELPRNETGKIVKARLAEMVRVSS
jgi:acyl-CoA synthetase (AMP-forming)/AMP-acid ligase II